MKEDTRCMQGMTTKTLTPSEFVTIDSVQLNIYNMRESRTDVAALATCGKIDQ